MSDGARDALAGYLYQIVGAAGLSARAIERSDERGNLTCALVIEARGAKVLHEVRGQDVMMRREEADQNSGIAVQFKFSREGAGKEIQPTELREILNSFDHCRRQASSSFPVTGYILITNRALGQSAQQRYNRRNTPFSGLKPAETRWLSVPRAQTVRIKQDYHSTEAAAQAWYAVFERLTVYPRIQHDYWVKGLQEYARKRGLVEEEFAAALSRLVGEALGTTVQGIPEFSQGWLNRCLLGFPDARTLELRAGADSAQQEANRIVLRHLDESFALDESRLIRRQILNKVGEQAAQHPIVFLLGRGGCGKSVLALQYLRQEAQHQFACAKFAGNLADRWLGHAFNSWRCSQSALRLPDLSDHEVVRRLCLANPNADRPVLVLAIDGLDEVSPLCRSPTRQSIDFGRSQDSARPSNVVLLLTARLEGNDIQRALRKIMADWLSTDIPRHVVLPVGYVQIGDFSSEELSAAVQFLDTDVRTRLQTTLILIDPENTASTSVNSAQATDVSDGVANPEIIAALRHPVLWGEFSRLHAKEQLHVLDGNTLGLDMLADSFIERFCLKAQRRRDHLQVERVRSALVQIGIGVRHGQQLANRDTDWIHRASGELIQTDAVYLFEEAISYGVIRKEEGVQWAWRHTFVGDFLRRQGGNP